MSDLPEEVITDILSRLPVKPLVQFKSVSIPWRSLIESPNFVKLHLNRSIETKSNQTLILREEQLYSVDFDSLDGPFADAVRLDHHPLRCQDYGTEVWGSCNGILCLSNSLDTVVLWNPSTRKSRRLPYAAVEFPNQPRYFVNRVYGFGYDSVSDDYKLVRIVVLRGKEDDSVHYEVKVYSLESNSWHRVGKFPHYPYLNRVGGVLASGNLHWVVNEETEHGETNLIVSFDLGCEEYGLVVQPEFTNTKFHLDVEVLGGCLSLICNYYLTNVDIWVMKEYGVKESWTKLISVPQPGVLRSFQNVRPIGYSKRGGEVLLQHGPLRLLWYDLKGETGKSVRMRDVQELSQVTMCVGSLVSLKSRGGKRDWKKKQEQEERNMGGFLSTGFKLVL